MSPYGRVIKIILSHERTWSITEKYVIFRVGFIKNSRATNQFHDDAAYGPGDLLYFGVRIVYFYDDAGYAPLGSDRQRVVSII